MKESDLLRLVMDYLAARKVFHFRNNSGALKTEKGYYVRFGCQGSPDIICCIDGQFVGIELKGDKGKQSPEQKVFQDHLDMAGGKYILAKSLEDIINGIKL